MQLQQTSSLRTNVLGQTAGLTPRMAPHQARHQRAPLRVQASAGLGETVQALLATSCLDVGTALLPALGLAWAFKVPEESRKRMAEGLEPLEGSARFGRARELAVVYGGPAGLISAVTRTMLATQVGMDPSRAQAIAAMIAGVVMLRVMMQGQKAE